MENVSIVGVDLSKNLMHAVYMSKNGTIVKRKKYHIEYYHHLLQDLPPRVPVCAEACSGSHHFARLMREHYHEAKLIPPQYVKPYVQRNKNDYNDAAAIAEYGSRKKAKFVPVKSEYIQGIQSLHTSRSQLVATRTQYINCIRGTLLEFGIRIPQGVSSFRNYIRDTYYTDKRVHQQARVAVDALLNIYNTVENTIDEIEKKIHKLADSNETVKRILTIPGIGKLTGTALITVSGDPKVFKNGRTFSAHLGLTPRQDTTADNTHLLGISKQGNKYVRTLLTVCARTLIIKALKTEVSSITGHSEYKSNDRMSLWIRKLRANNIHTNKICIAIANKLARIAYRIIVSNGGEYDAKLANS